MVSSQLVRVFNTPTVVFTAIEDTRLHFMNSISGIALGGPDVHYVGDPSVDNSSGYSVPFSLYLHAGDVLYGFASSQPAYVPFVVVTGKDTVIAQKP